MIFFPRSVTVPYSYSNCVFVFSKPLSEIQWENSQQMKWKVWTWGITTQRSTEHRSSSLSLQERYWVKHEWHDEQNLYPWPDSLWQQKQHISCYTSFLGLHQEGKTFSGQFCSFQRVLIPSSASFQSYKLFVFICSGIFVMSWFLNGNHLCQHLVGKWGGKENIHTLLFGAMWF